MILAFVTAYDPTCSRYPSVNFGAACGGITEAMAATAPSLLSCPLLAANITACQTLGKKVLLRLGGQSGTLSLAGPEEAEGFADTLWELFGPPEHLDPALRPFENVSVNGFDFGASVYGVFPGVRN